MKFTINFKEELEVLPVTLSFMLQFEGDGVVKKDYFRMNRNFVRALQYTQYLKEEEEKANEF